MLERWGGFVARRALVVLLVGSGVAIAAGAYGFGVFDSLSTGGFDDPDSEASVEREAEQDTFGNRSVDVAAIYSDDELTADSPEFRAAVAAVVADLPGDAVTAVVPYYDAPADQGLVSSDGHSAQVLISLEGETQDDVHGQLRRGRARPARRGTRRPTSPARSRSTTTSTRSPPRTSSGPS